jgi:PAS domain S-box-containing protein
MARRQEPERKKRSKPQPTRPTIGLLTRKLHYSWILPQVHGVVDACRERDINLVCFPGGIISHAHRFEAQDNIAYDLASIARLDGLIVLTSSVAGSIHDEKGLQDFYRRFHPRPIVGIERPSAGIPTILKSEYESMGEVLAHLIEVHGCRRIAYINRLGAGPQHERYQAYMDTLAKYGIPYDPNLVLSAHDNLPDFDEHKVRPGIDFEAVATCDDVFALEALQALQSQGIRVPEQVAIAGFDDVTESWTVTPPLTTVRPPFYEMGYQAVEMVLALLAGEEVPEQVTLPCKLVVRQSCGCMAAEVAQAAQPARVAKANRETLDAILATHRADIVADMAQAVSPEKPNSGWVEPLLDGFVAEVKGQSPGLFLRELDEALGQAGTAGNEVRLWQNGLSVLRRWLLPGLDAKVLPLADNLWQQARVMIGEVAERARAYQALRTEQQAQMLREVSQALITTFDVERLMDVLAEGLPRLSFPAGYLSLYETPQPYQYPQPDLGWSRLMLAYDERGRVELEPGGQRFPTGQLLPEEMWPDRQFSFVVEPLYFQNDQIGFALFDMGPREGSPYEALRGQISSALQGALLVKRVREHSAELTRQQYILDTFMETIPDRIYFKDLESRITRANRAHAIKLGLSDPAEEIGRSDFDFFPEEQARVKYEQEQEIIRTGQPLLNLEEVGGLGSWSLTTKMPLRDENGEIIGTFGISRDITAVKEAQEALEKAYAEVEQQVAERTAELEREIEERERAQAESVRLQQEVIEAQQRAIQELSTPIIPVLEGVIVMPLIGSIDTLRARDVTRSLLAGIREHHAKVVILDITGVPIVDSGVAAYLNKTVQAARLKGARTIVTGISEAVAETIVDLGIDWSGIETLRDLRTGLRAALQSR